MTEDTMMEAGFPRLHSRGLMDHVREAMRNSANTYTFSLNDPPDLGKFFDDLVEKIKNTPPVDPFEGRLIGPYMVDGQTFRDWVVWYAHINQDKDLTPKESFGKFLAWTQAPGSIVSDENRERYREAAQPFIEKSGPFQRDIYAQPDMFYSRDMRPGIRLADPRRHIAMMDPAAGEPPAPAKRKNQPARMTKGTNKTPPKKRRR